MDPASAGPGCTFSPPVRLDEAPSGDDEGTEKEGWEGEGRESLNSTKSLDALDARRLLPCAPPTPLSEAARQ